MIEFTDKEYEFFNSEFGLKKNDVDKYSEDEYIELEEKCVDIEVYEVYESGYDEDKLSERGKLATEIVTKIGKAID